MRERYSTVSGRELRKQFGDLIVRAGGGETIVIEHRGWPVAILRKARPDEDLARISMFEFRRHTGRTLKSAKRRPILVHWYRRRSVVVEPIPETLMPKVPPTEEAE